MLYKYLNIFGFVQLIGLQNLKTQSCKNTLPWEVCLCYYKKYYRTINCLSSNVTDQMFFSPLLTPNSGNRIIRCSGITECMRYVETLNLKIWNNILYFVSSNYYVKKLWNEILTSFILANFLSKYIYIYINHSSTRFVKAICILNFVNVALTEFHYFSLILFKHVFYFCWCLYVCREIFSSVTIKKCGWTKYWLSLNISDQMLFFFIYFH